MKPNADKTHCKNGHPLWGDNLYTPMRDGEIVQRVCRFCKRNRMRVMRGKPPIDWVGDPDDLAAPEPPAPSPVEDVGRPFTPVPFTELTPLDYAVEMYDLAELDVSWAKPPSTVAMGSIAAGGSDDASCTMTRDQYFKVRGRC